jgi:hypothetical protein
VKSKASISIVAVNLYFCGKAKHLLLYGLGGIDNGGVPDIAVYEIDAGKKRSISSSKEYLAVDLPTILD